MTRRIHPARNFRLAQAERRWRNKVVWPSTDQRERGIIKAELRRDDIGHTLNRVWGKVWKDGYDPQCPQVSLEHNPQEWGLIEDLTKEQERLAKRVARWEQDTGRSADELMNTYTRLNIKSVCF